MSARKKRITFEKLDVNPNYAGEDEVSESENNEDIAPKKHRTYAFRPAKRRESEANGKVYAVGFMPVFVLFAISFALAAILFILERQGVYASLSARQTAALYAVREGAVFLIPALLYVFAFRKEGVKGLYIHRFSPVYTTFLALSLFLMIAAVAAEKFSLACFFSGLSVREPIRLSFQNDFWLNLILYVVIPVLCEEIFFRSVLQGALSHAAGGFTGIFVGALAYALIHLDLAGFPVYFTTGLLLGAIMHVCGSVVPAILVHTAFRFVSLTFSAQLSFIASERAGGLFVLVILILAVFLFLLFYIKSLEVVCTKKSISVYVQNAAENGEASDPDDSADEKEETDSENIVCFREKPFRMGSDTGYTLHKFFRVLFSPAMILATVAYFLILFL